MKNQNSTIDYDAIIVGSGTCGATIARELTRQKKKVLILERGGNNHLKESFFTVASISDVVSLGDKLMAMRALTTGGSTALYFAVADLPPLDIFKSLGIDLARELEETRGELSIAELPDELIGPQSLRLKEAASKSGFQWKKKLMLIDQSKCASGYSYESKWKARSFVKEATDNGATLLNHAMVTKVIVDNNKAVGVEYKLSNKKSFKAYGTKIILAAGAAATPIILRESGLKNIENHGFFIDPNCALFGIVPGLKAKDNYMGSMSMDYEDDVVVGDLNATRFFYKMLMIGNGKFGRLFSYSNTIGVGVKVKDNLGGELRENNRYYKQLTVEDRNKLKLGEAKAEKILKNAGAKNIYHTGYGATDLGGTIKIQKHLDEKLETEYKNLYVCDGSVIPENVRISPTLTLICLGKYLSKHLLVSI